MVFSKDLEKTNPMIVTKFVANKHDSHLSSNKRKEKKYENKFPKKMSHFHIFEERGEGEGKEEEEANIKWVFHMWKI